MEFFATSARHLEGLLAEELGRLGLDTARETRAGARFSGGLREAYTVCLWSRLANRVLLPLASFPAADPQALYAGVQAIDWAEHLTPRQTLVVHADSARSGITHGHFAALKVKDAIVDQFRQRTGDRPSIDTERPDIALHCHLFRDQATLSLNLSGDSLHRRGYRLEAGAAPLKETLAAALLLRADWPEIAAGGGSLIDPLCGSGTLPIEAALLAADIAPGLLRQQSSGYWGFNAWRQHDAALWDELLQQAGARRDAGLRRLRQHGIRIQGFDQDPRVIRTARDNAARAGLSGVVTFEQRALADCRPPDRGPPPEPVPESAPEPAPPGLIITNPPYGLRLGAGDALPLLYAQLGEVLKHRFDGWRAAVLTGDADLGKRMGLRATRLHVLYNGPVECRLLHFDIRPTAHVSDTPRPLPPRERGPGAEMLANRLRKNQKALSRWLRDQGISCYRLYDADLPEYALALDIYTLAPGARSGKGSGLDGDSDSGSGSGPRRVAHLQEYAPPASIDARAARRRLREAIGVIAEVLELSERDLFFKVRQKQKGTDQYQRLADRGRFHQVQEDGLRLLVNFEDYLDTGLFLDHRDTRRLLRRLATGRHFLNLFGYTGTASVHAASGGARSTCTLDMSRTYLDWARRNLALNGFSGRDHQLIQADCIEWLRNARAYRGHFGLIFLDPPTFSSSKRMQGTFDVQRDHVELILGAADLLAPDGTLIFSNNRRRFQLDSAALAGLQVQDISPQTIPRDFARNPHIHRCWRITRETAAP
ncbi:bifunctional 23S rRNA (guanine(2069)-N(7))-methyltransferase RlmK/23S rRNA (guanine(2445)-N(2))-methyltransferase RlmL [Thiohalocapsa marina]|uniref:bifunctional 23S rRNA (guanine(2069)-N(7))-methyltransferase RlmK/23S rRNA (guanine(2445)-N(2))-methyltransferase RlmL n=1 Tax=Thiohalocapsa marina TaxID=424902 RepID=UPI0036DAF381